MAEMSRIDRMKATKFIEEQCRPDLPVKINSNQTWALSAQELMNESPEIYAGIVSHLSDGATNHVVARLTSQPVELIRKIRDLHPQLIESGRKAAHARIEEALHLGSTQLVDAIAQGKIKPSQLTVAVGILTDKSQLLSGGATQRVEKVDVKSPEQLKQWFSQLPEAKVIEVEKREVS
jgi:hypothetical protein